MASVSRKRGWISCVTVKRGAGEGETLTWSLEGVELMEVRWTRAEPGLDDLGAAPARRGQSDLGGARRRQRSGHDGGEHVDGEREARQPPRGLGPDTQAAF